MQPAYQSTIESGGASSSCEDLHPGLVYTPAYYEEEQMYSNNFLESSGQCGKHKASPCVNPAVEINEHCTTNIDLPPILWHGYKTVPKILSLTNTGKTILINGQWVKGRPYIEGGPLNGTYIFSQIHFHSPSEHIVGGKRYPLEMHAVHYKTSYLTQERAMLERDGTVVLVYLFQVLDTNQTDFSSVTKLAPKIEKVNSRTETTDVSLAQIVKPFTSNYYVYWGSVRTGKNSYLLQWIVNGGIVYVTRQEADELLAIMNFGEINVKSIPRMKPENNAIYYVEEVEQEEEKEDKQEHDCNACRSYQEWWLSHFSHTCSNNENNDDDEIYDSYSNLQYCLCKKGDDSQSQPVITCKKNIFPSKNYSGLRLCCHKMRKPVRKVDEVQPVTVCCTKDGKVCACPGPEHLENCKVKEVVVTKDTASCLSVTTKAQLPACTEEPACEENNEVVKMKVVCSCPSVKKCSDSNKCDEEAQVKSKKKKTDSCKDICRGTSSAQINKKKQIKKKNQKTEDDCEDVKPSSVKREKKSSPKRVKKSDPDCDAKKSSSKSSSNNKKPKGKASKVSEDSCKENEIPVECVITTGPEKSFDEILREYDTTWLEDSNLKMSIKTDSDDFCDKSIDIVSLKPSYGLDEDTITTIFEKKRELKLIEPPAEDCTVDFLLKPNYHKSNPSSSYMSPKSMSEELKCVENEISNKSVNVRDITVNTVTLSGIRIPTENPNELPKEFCVQVELLFHSNNRNFSECVTQEYNLALMYDQNVLQEYRGTLCPKNLQIGNYEKLELVPKYPELDNISIRLQDCTVKMESSDQICMRAKFLMKEINLKNLDTVGEQEGKESTNKKITVLSDAVTQCSVKEFDKPLDFDILEKISLQAKVSEIPQRSFPGECSSPKSPVNFSTPSSQLSEQSVERGSLKNEIFENKGFEIKSEVPEKLVENTGIDEGESSKQSDCSEKERKNSCCPEHTCKKSNCSQERYKNSNSSDGNSKNSFGLGEACKSISFEQIEEEEEEEEEDEKEEKKDNFGKELKKKAVKELKNIFSNRKKTVYFMYEKVEKDENSGKKVFIGSFRSKDDVKGLTREKKSNHSIEDSEEEKKLLLLSAKDSTSSCDFIQTPNPLEGELKIHSPTQSRNLLNDKKDMVTLRKFKPKHLRLRESKKNRFNLVVGKALNQLQKDSRNFKRLAELVGIDQKENSKISVYELKVSSKNEIPEKTSFIIEETENQTARDPSLGLRSDTLSHKNVGGKSSETEPVEGRKYLTKKGSQSAVFIIPVEVESLSRVEVVLVEHSDNAKKTVLKRGKEIIPCLDY